MKDALWQQALEATKSINEMEEIVAQEYFGCSYEDLDEDDRGFVTCEAYDRLDQ